MIFILTGLNSDEKIYWPMSMYILYHRFYLNALTDWDSLNCILRFASPGGVLKSLPGNQKQFYIRLYLLFNCYICLLIWTNHFYLFYYSWFLVFFMILHPFSNLKNSLYNCIYIWFSSRNFRNSSIKLDRLYFILR